MILPITNLWDGHELSKLNRRLPNSSFNNPSSLSNKAYHPQPQACFLVDLILSSFLTRDSYYIIISLRLEWYSLSIITFFGRSRDLIPLTVYNYYSMGEDH